MGKVLSSIKNIKIPTGKWEITNCRKWSKNMMSDKLNLLCNKITANCDPIGQKSNFIIV